MSKMPLHGQVHHMNIKAANQKKKKRGRYFSCIINNLQVLPARGRSQVAPTNLNTHLSFITKKGEILMEKTNSIRPIMVASTTKSFQLLSICNN